MKEKYNGFFVNFVTKNFLTKTNSNLLKIKGKAYYLFDENLIIYKQFIQIESTNFRPTDKEMVTTSYYKKNLKIRKDILEKIQTDCGYRKEEISKHNKIRINIENKDIIEEINKLLLKENRVKSSIDIFSGSNSSGAESNNLATNIVSSYPNDLKNCGLNFSNPFNRKEIYIKKDIDLESIDQINLIPFQDFLNKSKIAKKLLLEYNFVKLNLINEVDDLEINQNENLNNFEWNKLSKHYDDIKNEIKKYNIKSNPIEYYMEKVIDATYSYWADDKELMDKNKLKKFIIKLRNQQKKCILLEKWFLYKNNIHDYFYYNNFIENSKSLNVEHSHIIPVEYSKQNIHTLKEIFDPNNCLLLSPDFHRSFDKKQLYFDESGICFNSDNSPKENYRIKKEFLNTSRKEYLKKYKKLFFENL